MTHGSMIMAKIVFNTAVWAAIAFGVSMFISSRKKKKELEDKMMQSEWKSNGK